MSDQSKHSRLNRKSYIANSIFFLPAIVFGISLGNAHSDSEFTQGMMGIARLITLVLVGFYIFLTIRRLHDINLRGWFSFLLVPPFTLFFLIYLFSAAKNEANRWGESVAELRMFGIHAKGWRIAGIAPIAILFCYLAGLFATFLFDSSTF